MRSDRVSAFAALAGTAVALGDVRSFAVMHFNNQPLTTVRLDPIVSPGQTAAHVHHVFGASNFGANVTFESLSQSECTDAVIVGDNSVYWVPSMYYVDYENGTVESVPLFYGQVYYFFEPSNDKIVAFPPGLQIFTGNVSERNPPKGGCTGNLDPSKGPIQNVRWTCPRDGDEENPPSWPAGSDGTMSGMGDPNNKGEGCGFPDVSCDGFASPHRLDIHLPSCYNPEAGLTNYLENMAFPTDAGNGKQDCPPGWWHVPHLFVEVYYNTLIFRGRWQEGQGRQPFTLSNGDVTGFSGHADFISGWDPATLQDLIDTCDAGTSAFDKCPGVVVNNVNCQIPPAVDEKTQGTLAALPGNNPLTGWWMGSGDESAGPPPPSPSNNGPASSPSSSLKPAAPSPHSPASSPSSSPKPAASSPIGAGSSHAAAATPSPNGNNGAAASSPTHSSQPPTPASSSKKNKPCKASPLTETTTTTSTILSTATVTVSRCTSTTSALQAASPTQTNAPSQGVLGYAYVGCFQDTNARVLRGDELPALGPMSTEKCVGRCKQDGYPLAGTEYGGQCFCGDKLEGSSKIDESKCSMPCEGDASEICGGGLALSMWSSTGQAGVAGVPGVDQQQSQQQSQQQQQQQQQPPPEDNWRRHRRRNRH